MNDTVIEIIGYAGSALVLVSFLMASVVKLRVVNAVGSLIFAVYALIIRSYPTALMNVCLVLINLYYLWKLRNKEPNYRLLRLQPDEGFVRAFLDAHQADIAAFFPTRRRDAAALNRAFVVCHGDEAAGLLLGAEADGVLDIALDYSTPAYRDSSVGRYLHEHLAAEGLSVLRYAGAESAHLPYLQKMGYTAAADGAYEKRLNG